MEKYKEANKKARRATSEAKRWAYDELYQRLGTKEGEKGVYKMAKIRERKPRGLKSQPS